MAVSKWGQTQCRHDKRGLKSQKPALRNDALIYSTTLTGFRPQRMAETGELKNMKNMNEINGNMNAGVEGGNAIEKTPPQNYDGSDYRYGKERVDDYITINGNRPPIAFGQLYCQDVIIGGNENARKIEVIIDLKQCPHNSIESLEEGFMLLCHDCSEHYTNNALRFNGIMEHTVSVWINDDGHAHTAHEYLSYCMNQDNLNLRHLENLMLYIQSHLHHPNNEWGQGGLNYWDWTGQGAE